MIFKLSTLETILCDVDVETRKGDKFPINFPLAFEILHPFNDGSMDESKVLGFAVKPWFPLMNNMNIKLSEDNIVGEAVANVDMTDYYKTCVRKVVDALTSTVKDEPAEEDLDLIEIVGDETFH